VTGERSLCRRKVMKNWVTYLGVLSAGAIMLAGGLALRTPDFYGGRWSCYIVGGIFMTLGVGGLIFGHPGAVTPFPPDNGLARLAVGWSFILFGAIGAVHVAVWYPFDTSNLRPGERAVWYDEHPWAGQAPWIGWVFFAALVWAILAGIVTTFVIRPEPRQRK
jgi:hypothetical protein